MIEVNSTGEAIKAFEYLEYPDVSEYSISGWVKWV